MSMTEIRTITPCNGNP